MACLAGPAAPGRWTGGLVGGDRSSPQGRSSSTSPRIRRCTSPLTSPEYDKLVWRPDWRGSICFLVSGAIAYRASRRHGWHGWLPVRGGDGWWQPAVNLLGCIFFGISAVAGYLVPATGSLHRPGSRQLEHVARRRVLPGLRSRHPALQPGLEDATPAAAAAARARARGRRPQGDLRPASEQGYPTRREALPRHDVRLPDERPRLRADQGPARGARARRGALAGARRTSSSSTRARSARSPTPASPPTWGTRPS